MPTTGFLIRSGALAITHRMFSKFGRGGSNMPIMTAIIEAPAVLASAGGKIKRLMNQNLRAAMVKEMKFHHNVRIPEHFDRFRQKKYDYAERSERTKRIKRRRGQADLVKRKKLKNRVTSTIRISFPRSAPGFTTCRGKLSWPPGFKFSGAAKKGVTPEVMAREITRFTLREEQTAAKHIRNDYIAGLDRTLSKRARTKIGPGGLRRLGIGV